MHGDTCCWSVTFWYDWFHISGKAMECKCESRLYHDLPRWLCQRSWMESMVYKLTEHCWGILRRISKYRPWSHQRLSSILLSPNDRFGGDRVPNFQLLLKHVMDRLHGPSSITLFSHKHASYRLHNFDNHTYWIYASRLPN